MMEINNISATTTIRQIDRVRGILDRISELTPQNRFIALMVAESFINGMNVQERLDRMNGSTQGENEKTPRERGGNQCRAGSSLRPTR